MRKKLIILGARPDGHSIVVVNVFKLMDKFKIEGLLDDSDKVQGKSILGIPVLGKISLLKGLRKKVDSVFIAMGDNDARLKHAGIALKLGYELVNAIHPSAIIAEDVEIGKGVFIAAGVVINPNVNIGDLVVVNTQASLDHDDRIGRLVFIAPGCHLAGRVCLKEGVFLGTGVSIIPDVTIGKWSIIGAGSVVTKDIASCKLAVGRPCRVIKDLKNEKK